MKRESVFAVLVVIIVAFIFTFVSVDLSDSIAEDKIDYDQAPSPVGGFAAVAENLVYPAKARKAGIEGRVLLSVFIDTNGVAGNISVIKSICEEQRLNEEGNKETVTICKDDMGCDQAAEDAIRKTEWEPAQKNGKAVAVEVVIPIHYRLE
ncbi:TonB family protein [candidate division KSB1 bacterium]|nr:TonB family protein [candidate division KSB1 bacterium]